MAEVTLSNSDIKVLAAEACVQENLPVDELGVHTLNITPQTASGTAAQLGDTAKIPVYSATGSAATFNKSTNNYETSDGQSVVYKDVAITERKKRTIQVDALDILRLDVAPLLRLETENVYRTVVDDINATILAANFAEVKDLGVVGSFDSDVVVGLRELDQIRKYPRAMRKLALNVPFSIQLQKDNAIKNHNTQAPVGLPSNTIVTNYSQFASITEMEQLAANGEDLAGIVTNGCGIAIAMPSVFQAPAMSQIEQTMFMYNGVPMMLRRHQDSATGDYFITVEAQYGFEVADEKGIVRLTGTLS